MYIGSNSILYIYTHNRVFSSHRLSGNFCDAWDVPWNHPWRLHQIGYHRGRNTVGGGLSRWALIGVFGHRTDVLRFCGAISMLGFELQEKLLGFVQESLYLHMQPSVWACLSRPVNPNLTDLIFILEQSRDLGLLWVSRVSCSIILAMGHDPG